MSCLCKILLTAGLLSLPVATLAQAAPAEVPQAQKIPEGKMMRHGGGDGLAGMRLRDVMAKLSPEGQKIMHDGFLAQKAQSTDHREKLRAVRDKILVAMSAEKFDASALKRAFAEERALSAQAQERRHALMLQSLSKLSVADRMIIVASVRDAQNKMRMRMMQRLQNRPAGDADMIAAPATP